MIQNKMENNIKQTEKLNQIQINNCKKFAKLITDEFFTDEIKQTLEKKFSIKGKLLNKQDYYQYLQLLEKKSKFEREIYILCNKLYSNYLYSDFASNTYHFDNSNTYDAKIFNKIIKKCSLTNKEIRTDWKLKIEFSPYQIYSILKFSMNHGIKIFVAPHRNSKIQTKSQAELSKQ